MKCLIIGATGLIGSHVLSELIESNDVNEIVILVRKKINISNSKVNQIVFDFNDKENYKTLPEFDAIFSCLGTTIKVAGSKENFAKVDLEYPLNIATHVKTNKFLLVSSMGANHKSSVFYVKIKGELEEELKKLNFESLHIFRPSQLTGDRKEKRLGERVSEKAMRLFDFMIPKEYKLIKASTVAKAMKNMAINNKKGEFIYSSDQIKSIAANEKI